MYEKYLRQLLAPLGVYDLTEGSVNGAELYALGVLLDQIGERMELAERESLTATAEDEGLRRREALFARRPAAVTAAERRAAIAALLQIDGDSLTPSAINHTLLGSGIRARAVRLTPDTCGWIFRMWAVCRRSSIRFPVLSWIFCPVIWMWNSISAT